MSSSAWNGDPSLGDETTKPSSSRARQRLRRALGRDSTLPVRQGCGLREERIDDGEPSDSLTVIEILRPQPLAALHMGRFENQRIPERDLEGRCQTDACQEQLASVLHDSPGQILLDDG